MHDLFLFKADLFPFPGAWGIEYVAMLYWRAILWIGAAFSAMCAVEWLTERVRARWRGLVVRWIPGIVLLACMVAGCAAAVLVYRRLPKAEYLVQYNRLLSVPEVVLLCLCVGALACWGAAAACRRGGARRLTYRVLIAASALGSMSLLVATLGWKVVVYRLVWVAFAEFALSLALVSVALALSCRRAWRWWGWKSLAPKAAWTAAAGCTAAGWVALCGLAGLVLDSCA